MYRTKPIPISSEYKPRIMADLVKQIDAAQRAKKYAGAGRAAKDIIPKEIYPIIDVPTVSFF